MLSQIEIRTLSGELRYGLENQQHTLPELCGSILLPKNHAMLIRVCEHRKSVMNGTYKPKQLSEETIRRFRLRPEYAKPGKTDTDFMRSILAEGRREAESVIAEATDADKARTALHRQALSLRIANLK